MAQELIYTSSPRGLRIGASGFCTVACTRGMGANYVEVLESLSAYAPVFPVNHPQSHLNPVAYSHYRYVIGGHSVSILSRVGDAGTDYTHRTNKLAYHLVVDPAERPPGGPAWVMQKPGMMVTEWEGEPAYIDAPKRIPQGAPPMSACKSWERALGDAGWAGVLAQSFLDDPAKPSFVIFEPGAPTLELVAEAIQLLSPEQRWAVTFCTYLTTLPAGTGCSWRFCLKNSPQLKQARSVPGTLVIDLTPGANQSAEAAARFGRSSCLVEMARTGVASKNVAASSATAPALELASQPPARQPSRPPAISRPPAQRGLHADQEATKGLSFGNSRLAWGVAAAFAIAFALSLAWNLRPLWQRGTPKADGDGTQNASAKNGAEKPPVKTETTTASTTPTVAPAAQNASAKSGAEKPPVKTETTTASTTPAVVPAAQNASAKGGAEKPPVKATTASTTPTVPPAAQNESARGGGEKAPVKTETTPASTTPTVVPAAQNESAKSGAEKEPVKAEPKPEPRPVAKSVIARYSMKDVAGEVATRGTSVLAFGLDVTDVVAVGWWSESLKTSIPKWEHTNGGIDIWGNSATSFSGSGQEKCLRMEPDGKGGVQFRKLEGVNKDVESIAWLKVATRSGAYVVFTSPAPAARATSEPRYVEVAPEKTDEKDNARKTPLRNYTWEAPCEEVVELLEPIDSHKLRVTFADAKIVIAQDRVQVVNGKHAALAERLVLGVGGRQIVEYTLKKPKE